MFVVDFEYENYEGRVPLCFKDFDSALSYAKKLISKILDIEVNYYYYSESNIKLNPTRGTIGSLNDNKKCIVGYGLTRKDDSKQYY